MNETKYPVVAEYKGQNVVKSSVQVHNGGIAIPNELKLDRLTITKTGEMLVGAVESTNKEDILYSPRYEIRNLPGVTFNIIADEDIYDVYGRLIMATRQSNSAADERRGGRMIGYRGRRDCV